MREDGPDGKKKGRKRYTKGSQKDAAAKQPVCVNGSSKLSMVLCQASTRKGHIAGFQEMRAFETGIGIVDDRVVCRSAADQLSANGCGLAFNMKIPWLMAGDTRIFISRQDVTIEHAGPRFLCVGVLTAACEWLAICTHGPLSISNDASPVEHWQMDTLWIAKHSRGRPVLMCAHGNATLFEAMENCIGPVLSKKPLLPTQPFMECMSACHLCPPPPFVL